MPNIFKHFRGTAYLRPKVNSSANRAQNKKNSFFYVYSTAFILARITLITRILASAFLIENGGFLRINEWHRRTLRPLILSKSNVRFLASRLQPVDFQRYFCSLCNNRGGAGLITKVKRYFLLIRCKDNNSPISPAMSKSSKHELDEHPRSSVENGDFYELNECLRYATCALSTRNT